MGSVRLTRTERKVVDAIRAGAHSHKAIARAMGRGVTTWTVQSHIYRIARKIRHFHPQSPPLIRVVLWATFREEES